MTDRESVEKQLTEWIKGNSVHNELRDECCPDFSCCQPALLWSEETRKEFAEAGDEKRRGMLMMSLGAVLAHAGKRDEVYISGLDGGMET